MANAKIDSNGRQSMLGLLNTDGVTLINVKATPAGLLHVNEGTGGTNLGSAFADTDENGRTTMYALASDGSGTFVPLHVDSTGGLLINSN